MHTTTSNSGLVLGAMMFGTGVGERDAFALLDRFVDRGGVWIDTADCYSFWADSSGLGGQSERLIGRWLRARPGMRDRVKISTKLGAQPAAPGSWPEHRAGLSASAIHKAFDGSRMRLGVENVDLLWIHQEDRAASLEETVSALGELTVAGVVARVGASNHPAWRVESARTLQASLGFSEFDALQHSTSYLLPRPGTLPPGVVHRFGPLSDEHRDLAVERGMEVWAYSPLLSGAYDNPDKSVPDVYDQPGNVARLRILGDVASEIGVTRGQVVLAWLLANGVHPILGGSKLYQLDAALEAATLRLPADALRRLNSVDRTPWSDPYNKITSETGGRSSAMGTLSE
ncbi:oxidoreductase [Microbacterium sp. SZ1]|uniref:aldo/keto reductase n=1 Tax=Microbacterium sp. SZ1 TaxID=1849736 RepID=UPI000BBCBB9B|nr:aldo/keto reductase [Microbacterium sp. SZ1]PCE16327.1 oxidoreductase [Microbacterium sp. SZ1]